MANKRGPKPGAANAGRPTKEIDQVQFEKLCVILCTLDDICGFFDVGRETLLRWCKRTYGETFEETFKRKSAGGKISLRRKQYEMAMAGDRVLLIWLGKQHLGQRDTPAESRDDDAKPTPSVYKLHDANKPKSEAS